MPPRHPDAIKDEIKQSTHQQLLDAAAEEFANHGFTGANVNKIAKSAGFSIGTFYNYFPTKRELMADFIEDVSKAHVVFIMESVREVEDPEQRIKKFFQAGFQFVDDNSTRSRAIFNALNGPDGEFKLQLFEAYSPIIQLLQEEILHPGVSNGSFRSIDPSSTSNLIMLIYLGTGSQFSPEGKLWMDPNQVADFVLNGLK